MYDPVTADLIRATPDLTDLDRSALPDWFTEAFAKVAALRMRLRSGDTLPEELQSIRGISRELAHTNEALVALQPDRHDRRSAAFVAATAYQLVYQIDALSKDGTVSAELTYAGIAPVISAMLLFLVAESSADATEVANRVHLPAGLLERELIQSLVDLARGHLRSITQRTLLPATDVALPFGLGAASSALYHLVLRAVRRLAADLSGLPSAEEDIQGILRTVQDLASPLANPTLTTNTTFDSLELGPITLVPGPYHLASLLKSVADTLIASAVINVPAPPGVRSDTWQSFIAGLAEERPYLWPNHQFAISSDYLTCGISSVIGYPTGAGKSAVAQMKIAATIFNGKNAVFLAPTHALVDQTVRDLKRAIPQAKVRGERPDALIFLEPDLEPNDILVMTPEACLLLSHIEPQVFNQVGLLVFDECHLIHPTNETDRRSVDAMLCIINFVRLAPDADLVLLSAMMKNTKEIAAWLSELTGRLALDFDMSWKPTRQLRGCVVYEQSRINELIDSLESHKQSADTKGVPKAVQSQLTARPHGFFSIRQTWDSQQRADYVYLPFCDEMPQLGTNRSWRLTPNAGEVAKALAVSAAGAAVNTIVFSQSIPLAVSIANRVSDSLLPCHEQLMEDERRWTEIAVDELGGTDQLYVNIHDQTLTSRAAAHHGLLLPEERWLIESLYARKDGLTVLSATPTLGQGMNLPSEFVVIAEDSRFDQNSGHKELLEARELLNAAGRAGRAGKNATGVVVVIPGQVVGFDDTESRIGNRWSSLQQIFGQTDQCLEIDDPLSAILDRIHGQSHSPDDLDRYVVSRLCPVIEEADSDAVVQDMIRRTFGAFRRRRTADSAWVESRTESALTLLTG